MCVCVCVCAFLTFAYTWLCFVNFCVISHLSLLEEARERGSWKIEFEFSSRTTRHSYRLVIASVLGHFFALNIFHSLPRLPCSLPPSPPAVHSSLTTSWKNRWTSLKITRPIPHGISFALLSSSFGDTFPREKLHTHTVKMGRRERQHLCVIKRERERH